VVRISQLSSKRNAGFLFIISVNLFLFMVERKTDGLLVLAIVKTINSLLKRCKLQLFFEKRYIEIKNYSFG